MEKPFNVKLQNILEFMKIYRIIGIIVAIIGFCFLTFFLIFSQPDTELFYSGDQKSLFKVTKILNEKKIIYELKEGGIFIKKSDAPYASLEVFGNDQSIGMEIFDFRGMLTHENPFTQNIQYLRALQGELERSIKSVSTVSDCRIHINLPKSNLLQKNIDIPTAAVILKLNNKLTVRQIHGIQKLIASSVQGLLTENVVITDSNGNLLSKSTNLEDDREYQTKLVADLESLIVPITGKENIKIAVQVFYNNNIQTEEIENYSNPIIKNQHQYSQKNAEEAPSTDVATDLENNQVNSNTIEAKTEYAVSCLKRRSNYNGGNIERISVAIVLNDALQVSTDEVEKLVRSFIGFNPTRGDQISVVAMKFLEDAAYEVESIQEEQMHLSLLIIFGVILCIISLSIMYYFNIRKKVETFTTTPTQETLTDDTNLNDLVKKIVHESPRQAKQLVRFWLSLGK